MWGQIAGAVVGGVMANQAAKKQADATMAAAELNNQGYSDARPYIQDMYTGGTDALNSALGQGYYGGPTYAGMNDMSQAGYNQMYNQGMANATDAQGFMNAGRGFANNYGDIYNRASGDMVQNAINYSTDSANYKPLLDTVMRDDTRNYLENTVRNNNMVASQSGNANSSRAGVVDAIAERGYNDRRTDASTSIQNELMNRSLTAQQNQLSNMTNANKNLAGLYNTGLGQMNNASNNMVNAGSAFQQDTQGQYNDARATFEGNRDFAMQQYNDYNAGILGRAPQTAARRDPNLVDPTMAGLSGALAGFGAGGQYGQQIMDFFTPSTPTVMPAHNPYGSVAPQYMMHGSFGG